MWINIFSNLHFLCTQYQQSGWRWCEMSIILQMRIRFDPQTWTYLHRKKEKKTFNKTVWTAIEQWVSQYLFLKSHVSSQFSLHREPPPPTCLPLPVTDLCYANFFLISQRLNTMSILFVCLCKLGAKLRCKHLHLACSSGICFNLHNMFVYANTFAWCAFPSWSKQMFQQRPWWLVKLNPK